MRELLASVHAVWIFGHHSDHSCSMNALTSALMSTSINGFMIEDGSKDRERRESD